MKRFFIKMNKRHISFKNGKFHHKKHKITTPYGRIIFSHFLVITPIRAARQLVVISDRLLPADFPVHRFLCSVNLLRSGDAYMRQWTRSPLVQIMCHYAIICTNADVLIRQMETNINEIWIKVQCFSLMKIHLKMSSAKWRHLCKL